ncbi:hypothetical protein I8748_22780 [Nostoc sp. CENA67]|uniref:Uncharacterized protein n=1 Tax=Amazonocrinis nigriterrae CENA67 TaxID=2794033 RepID=A0A8J7HYS0_9NOST|nr:hypothetical protein [Amazonocrinis nigriterrae]MBH8564974.1 hypothetical protein [Amazonocrinis nigriterrae CENA67]
MPYRYVDWAWVYYFVERLIEIPENERDSTVKHFPQALESQQIFDSLVLANDLVRSNGKSYARRWLQANYHWASKITSDV